MIFYLLVGFETRQQQLLHLSFIQTFIQSYNTFIALEHLLT